MLDDDTKNFDDVGENTLPISQRDFADDYTLFSLVTIDYKNKKGQSIQEETNIHIKLDAEACDFKKLIFKCLKYHINKRVQQTFSKPRINSLSAVCNNFVVWLNDYNLDANNRYTLLNDYQAHHQKDVLERRANSKRLGNKDKNVQSILKFLLPLIFGGLQSSNHIFLNARENALMENLYNSTKTINPTNPQESLASWVGQMDWLRDEEKGMGENLYSCWASPKLAVNSLKKTVATVLYGLQKERVAFTDFLKFLKEKSEMTDPLIEPVDFIFQDDESWSGNHRRTEIKHFNHALCIKLLDVWLEWLKTEPKKSPSSLFGYLCGAFFNLKKDFYEEWENLDYDCKDSVSHFLEKIKEKGYRRGMRYTKFFSTTQNNRIKVENFVCNDAIHESFELPLLDIERLCFHMLMASYCVQPSTIEKLTPSSFVKQVHNNKVTQLHIDYFKPRAQDFKQSHIISALSIEGKALIDFINLWEQQDWYIQCPRAVLDGVFSSHYGYFFNYFEQKASLSAP